MYSISIDQVHEHQMKKKGNSTSLKNECRVYKAAITFIRTSKEEMTAVPQRKQFFQRKKEELQLYFLKPEKMKWSSFSYHHSE